MSSINPVSGLIPPLSPPVAASRSGGQTQASFGQTLHDCLQKVDAEQQSSATAIQDLLAGKTEDVLPVVSAVAKADLSFKLLIGVRNKVVEAYKQTLNMQV